MRSILFSLLFSTIAACKPSLHHLYSSNATLGQERSFGPGPYGTQVSIPIKGGTFEGPKLSGKVLPIGAEWGILDNQNVFQANARYQLQTNDGANIFVHATGPTQPDGQVFTHLVLQTGHKSYDWLNNIVIVGISTLGEDWVAVDAYELIDADAANASINSTVRLLR